ncbi:hypothetical protein D3C76_1836620 [compost metagenome]
MLGQLRKDVASDGVAPLAIGSKVPSRTTEGAALFVVHGQPSKSAAVSTYGMEFFTR